MRQSSERAADYTRRDRCEYCGQPVEPWQGRVCGVCNRQTTHFSADDDHIEGPGGGYWHSGGELARYQYEAALGYQPDRDYWVDDYDDDDSD